MSYVKLCKLLCNSPCGLCLAVSLLVTGCLLGVLLPIFVDSQVQAGIRSAALIDGPNAAGYGQFVNHSYQSENRFYVTFFNITNAVEILAAPNVKPRVEEIGPFVYMQPQMRSNVSFDSDTDTITYRQHSWLEFSREETRKASKGKFDSDSAVKITTINLLFLGMRVQAGKSYWHVICDWLLWKTDYDRLFELRTPKEMLVGYNVSIKLPLLPAVKLSFPGLFPNTPVSADPDMQHRSTIRTGSRAPEDTFSFVAWREQRDIKTLCPYGSLGLPFDEQCKSAPYPCCGQREPVAVWDSALAPGEFDEDANVVKGTTGDQFRPGLHSDSEQVEVFFDLAQRVIPFVTKPGEALDNFQGVWIRRFRPDTKSFWGNSTVRPANARYYQWGPSGLLNLTVVFGTDIYVSLPHYLRCDDSLVNAVEGIKPDAALHDLYLGVEPHSGITIVEQQRAMLSARIHREAEVPGVDKGWFPNLEDRVLYVPVAWFNQQGLATPAATSQFADVYTGLAVMLILRIVGRTMAAVAVLWVLLLGVPFYRRRRQAGGCSTPDPLLSPQAAC